jgi:hypothetical protein
MDVSRFTSRIVNYAIGWIIVIGFRVLLITQYLIQEILVEAVSGVYAKGERIKSFSIQML